MENKIRLIAFYLPQYHPIPENDVWWGKGFTEWTNVAKAKPLFKGHYQPHLPADLGFYDLRIPEVREAQAEMARDAGIEGFCYWHYWFAGKQLLERPFNEVLASGKPDYPFCLAWANQSWTGIWHGAPDRVLIEQTYPGKEDHIAHFNALLPAFSDDRYIKVDGKPIFVVYKPNELPDPDQFISLWQDLAIENGLNGIYFLGMRNSTWDHLNNGFDGIIFDNLSLIRHQIKQKKQSKLDQYLKKIKKRLLPGLIPSGNQNLLIYSYRELVAHGLPNLNPLKDEYPTIFPNWDNTPRANSYGFVFQNSTPKLFQIQLTEAIRQVNSRPVEKQLIFIKSWNEWAEGNYLEPDQKFGKAYLDAICEIINRIKINGFFN